MASGANLDLTIYNNYLNQLTSIKADFSQLSPDDKVQHGKFYLQKPGKMRWDYLKPKPFTIIINGNKLTHYDKILDEATYGSSEELAVHFLTKEQLKLEKDANVLSLDKATDGTISITLTPKLQNRKNAKYSDFKLRLVFSNKPLALQQIITIDPENNYTIVSLQNLNKTAIIDDKLFYLANPKLERKAKND